MSPFDFSPLLSQSTIVRTANHPCTRCASSPLLANFIHLVLGGHMQLGGGAAWCPARQPSALHAADPVDHPHSSSFPYSLAIGSLDSAANVAGGETQVRWAPAAQSRPRAPDTTIIPRIRICRDGENHMSRGV